MKKSTVILASVLTAGVLFVPAAFYSMAASAGTGETSARKTALEHAGVAESQVAFIRTESDYENGRLVYEVEFYTTDYKEYDYEIEAESGKILSWDSESEYYDAAEAQKQGRYLNGSLSTQTEPGKVSMEEARQTALDFAGVREDQAVFLKEKTGYEDGRQVYEIEFRTDGYVKYEFEIDTESGEIAGYDFEDNSGRGTQEQGELLETAEVQKIAAARAGLEPSDVRFLEMELEKDDGCSVYEGEFVCDSGKYEFEIDGTTGKIVKWEK